MPHGWSLANGSKTVAERAAAILDWLSQQPNRARRKLDRLVRVVPATHRASLRGDTALVNKALARQAARPAATATRKRPTASWPSRTPAARIRLAAVSAALATLAGPVAQGYAQRKDEAGLLDYDDLIDRTRTLLVDPGAAWVLYKLDGGLDHLLLDEVQDTAPQQWRIAHALTEEFFAGPGRARPDPHRLRGRRPQAVDLLLPGRRHGRSSTAPATNWRAACARPARCSRMSGWTCRSAPPRRCWRWWTRCSPIRWRVRAWSPPAKP